jgi:hypothetical protein
MLGGLHGPPQPQCTASNASDCIITHSVHEPSSPKKREPVAGQQLQRPCTRIPAAQLALPQRAEALMPVAGAVLAPGAVAPGAGTSDSVVASRLALVASVVNAVL